MSTMDVNRFHNNKIFSQFENQIKDIAKGERLWEKWSEVQSY